MVFLGLFAGSMPAFISPRFQLPNRLQIVPLCESSDFKGVLPANKPKKTIYSDSELISILQKKFKELGRPPKYYEVQQATTMAFRFGSWNKALKAFKALFQLPKRKAIVVAC